MKKDDGIVSVHHEWGKLKEVIVGIGDDLVIPSYSEAVSFFYDPAYIDEMKKYGGTDARKLDPKGVKQAKGQIDNLARVLQKQGVVVYRSKRLSKEEMEYLGSVQKGSHFFYARDPVLVIGSNVIETAISIPFKVKERYAIRPILRKRLEGSSTKHVSMPVPSPVFGRDQIYLEGGDVLLNGREIYVGISGKGSSPKGAEWLQHFLGSGYRVHQIKLSPEFEHLDCVLSLVRPGLGVRCKDAIIGELPESIRNWDYVEVTKEEAKRLGANLLILDEKSVIIDKQHHRIGKELTKKGVRVIEIAYDKVATWGGGLRCSHHPLVRESVLPLARTEIVTGATLSAAVQKRLKKSFRPPFLFEDKTNPKAADYRLSSAWAALPKKRDDADFAPPNTKYPEAQKNAPADVFFVHPTGYSKPDSWNGPIDDPEAVQAVSLVMNYVTSCFNAAACVYAPRYRQASLYAFLDYETLSGINAINLAYSDVERAFEHYVKSYNRGRPFILASHSQGSNHALRLLQQKIIGTPMHKRLVAAYLVGMAIPNDIPGINPSRSATDTGTVIGWNSYLGVVNK